jgi:hypothetical protein
MVALVLASVLSAGPTAAQAEGFAAKAQWEELYLAFAATSPTSYPAKDQAKVGKALTKGCEALLPSDAVMAFSLGEKAVAFGSTPAAVVCTARAAIKTDQRSAADEALRIGLRRHPKDGELSLELGRLLFEEHDHGGAMAVLGQVPRTSKVFPQAQRLLQQAVALAREEAQARAVLSGGGKPAGSSGGAVQPPLPPDPTVEEGRAEDDPVQVPSGRRPPPSTSASRSYESSVDEEGRRIRQNAYFRFRYFSAKRDFGQRADY